MKVLAPVVAFTLLSFAPSVLAALPRTSADGPRLAARTNSRQPRLLRIELYAPSALDGATAIGEPVQVAFTDRARIGLSEEALDQLRNGGLRILVIDEASNEILADQALDAEWVDLESGLLELTPSQLETLTLLQEDTNASGEPRLLEISRRNRARSEKRSSKRTSDKKSKKAPRGWQGIWEAEAACHRVRPQLKEGFRVVAGPSFFRSSQGSPGSFSRHDFHLGQCIAYREAHCQTTARNKAAKGQKPSSALGMFQFTNATRADCNSIFSSLLHGKWNARAAESVGKAAGRKVRADLQGCLGSGFRTNKFCAAACYYELVKRYPTKWETYKVCKSILAGRHRLDDF